MKRGLLIGGVVALLLLGGGGLYLYNGYRAQAEHFAAARGGVPPRPSLASFPSELTQRIASAEQAVRTGKDPVEALSVLARLYHANGFEAEAVVAYKALAVAQPSNAQWPHLLANILATYGQSEAAVRLWRHVVQMAPDYLAARIKLGDALVKLNQFDEADRVYAAGLQASPDNPYLLAGRGRVAMAGKQWESARGFLEAAAQKSENRIGIDLLVTVYEQSGDMEKALSLRGLAKSFGTYFDPADPWADAVYDDCYDPYRIAMGSGMADRRGDMATALRLMERAVRIDPNYALAYFHLGKLQARNSQFAEAEKSFRRAIELDPIYGDSWIGLYELMKRQNNTAGAQAVLREGLVRCPESPGLHLENGKLLRAANNLDGALAEFELVMKLRPAEVDALIEIAKIHFNREQVEEGVAEMSRVLDILPGHPVALSTLAYFWIESGDKAKAQYWLRQCWNQPRLARDDVLRLAQRFQTQFGQSPW